MRRTGVEVFVWYLTVPLKYRTTTKSNLDIMNDLG